MTTIKELVATMGKIHSPLSEPLAKIRAQTKAIQEIGGLAESMRRLQLDPAALAIVRGEVSSAKQLAELNDQHERFLKAIPPDPAYKTNDLLANIDARFDRIEKIAVDSAEIAASLQESAAIFLTKFEAAAAENDASVKKTIWMGKVAIGIALLTSLVPIAYSEWKSRGDAEATQALIKSNNSAVGVLGEIKDILSKGMNTRTAKNPVK